MFVGVVFGIGDVVVIGLGCGNVWMFDDVGGDGVVVVLVV